MGGPTNTQFAVAVHALTLLGAMPDALQSSEQMAVSVGSNPVYMRRVLGLLREAGIVDSRPGPRGGWRLRHAAAHISLADVWRAVHADGQVLGLHAANPDCPVGRSVQGALVGLDRRAATAIVAELERTSVGEVLAAAGGRAAATG